MLELWEMQSIELFEIELCKYIKMDSALNNLQWVICHKTKPNETKPNLNNLQRLIYC